MKWMAGLALAPALLFAQELKTAGGHSIQYYVSLPQGWTAAKKWPVVVIIESANRQFQETAEIYARARQNRPFILVTPLVVTNGGPRYREAPGYRYSEAVWAEIEQTGPCEFDVAGIAAVVKETREKYSAEERFYLAGWEAAGHTIWAVIFRHPEWLRAAALSGPNYAGRCLDERQFSMSPARAGLPVKVFSGEGAAGPGSPIFTQFDLAARVAREHGYPNVSREIVKKPHGPMADEILAYFASLR